MHAVLTTVSGFTCGICNKFYSGRFFAIVGEVKEMEFAQSQAENCCKCTRCEGRGSMVGGPGWCPRCKLVYEVDLYKRNLDMAAQGIEDSAKRLAAHDAHVAEAKAKAEAATKKTAIKKKS